ncbi:MAG: methyltransferase domain-containing protein [Pseudonocardiaceae bacterium]
MRTSDTGRLVAELDKTGLLTEQWHAAFGAVPRHEFLPGRLWVLDEHARLAPIDREHDVGQWMRRVYSDSCVVTQIDDGDTAWPGSGYASSSSSMPSVMLTMLDALDVGDRMRVLEIGTGTGYNAAILAHRVGADRVTTVEVDGRVAAAAAHNLLAAGYPVTMVCGDGTMGHQPGAPYDRVLVTCGVIGTVPYSWIEQARPGGLVVAPWGTRYQRSALLRLQVNDDGTALGRFSPGVHLSFMPLRKQRIGYFPDGPEGDPDVITTTELSPAELRHTVLAFDGSFAIGLRVPECRTWYEIDEKRGCWCALGFEDAGSGSHAIVTVDPQKPDIVIKQWGPRRLWDEVELAYQWWVHNGRPTHDRFGLSVGPAGQSVWLDEPGRPFR